MKENYISEQQIMPARSSTTQAPDVRDRLLELAHDHGASLSRLSRLIGRNSTYLQQFIRKGSPRKLEEEDRRVLAEFFGVDEQELGGRVGVTSPRVPQSESDARLVDNQVAPRASDSDWVEVPRIPLGASAGPGALTGAEQADDAFRFSRRWLREMGFDGANLSAIGVEGDSMEPLLRDGDEILVDLSARALRDGVHVVRLGDMLMVKRVAPAGAGKAALLSENPAYPALEIALDELEIIGRVVWKGGRI